jgi:hypothetical protein
MAFNPMDKPLPSPGSHWWRIGTRVRKIKGASWQGLIVGYYSTALTPEGYAVESEREPGSVQIYPRAALEAFGSWRT